MRFRKIFYVINFIGLVVQLYFLANYGVSSILLFISASIALYGLSRFFISKKNILLQFRILLISLIVIELFFLLIFKRLNTYTENDYGIYFSEYKKNEQVSLLHKLGLKTARNASIYGYEPKSSGFHETKYFNYKVDYNEIGLRGYLPSVKKDSNEYRVILLGDSFVEGFGAPNDSTIAILLEQSLTRSKDRVSVINAGICGSDPIREIWFYKNYLKKYEADLVVLVTIIDDLYDVQVRGCDGNMNVKMPLKEHLYAISHIYRAFDNLVLRNTILQKNSNKRQAKRRGDLITCITESLKSFEDVLKKEEVQFIPFYINHVHEFRDRIIDLTYQNSLDLSFENFVNLKSTFNKQAEDDETIVNTYYWPMDGHLNSTGYQLVGEVLSDKIIELDK